MFDFDSAKHYVLIFTLLSICRDKVKGHLYWQWVKKYWSYSCSCHTFTHNNDRSWPWSVGYCLTYLDSALLCLCYLIAYLLALLCLCYLIAYLLAWWIQSIWQYVQIWRNFAPSAMTTILRVVLGKILNLLWRIN